jgi:hypothetical protein
MDDRRYVIFDYSEVNKINFLQVMETSADTLRKSIDGTKTFVKYDGVMPSSVNSLHSKSQEYTHSEIITILSTSEWTEPIDNV